MDPIEALKRHLENFRMDSSDALFFARQLEHIRARSYDVKYPEIKFRSFIPVDNSVDPGAETITYRQYDKLGSARKTNNYSNNSPRVDVVGKEFTQAVLPYEASYGYTTQDIRRARMTGTDIDMLRAAAARRAIEEAFDQLAATGDTDTGIKGITNHASIPLVVLPNLGAFSGLTPQQMLDNLNTLVGSIVTTTKQVEFPDTLLLDTFTFQTVAQTNVGLDNQTSVLRSFLANNPWIKNIDSWHRLDTAGAGSIRRIIAYKRDPSVLEFSIPLEFSQMAPQLHGKQWIVECEGRSGGLELRYPKAVAHADIAT